MKDHALHMIQCAFFFSRFLNARELESMYLCTSLILSSTQTYKHGSLGGLKHIFHDKHKISIRYTQRHRFDSKLQDRSIGAVNAACR